MPRLTVKTTEARQVWESPDGQRKIYELELDYKGKPVSAKTYSDAIATEGWEGEVNTYEKTGKNRDGSQRIETFVKQPPKEGSFNERASAKGSYQPKDEKAIQAMWAIGQAVQIFNTAASELKLKPGSGEATAVIEAVAQELFLMVDRVKAVPQDDVTTEEPPVDTVEDPEQTSIEDIKEIFGEAEKAAEAVDEDVWKPKT